MDKQELFEQMEELLDEYLMSAETLEAIPVEMEEEPVEEESDGEMQEESDDEILKSIRQ